MTFPGDLAIAAPQMTHSANVFWRGEEKKQPKKPHLMSWIEKIMTEQCLPCNGFPAHSIGTTQSLLYIYIPALTSLLLSYQQLSLLLKVYSALIPLSHSLSIFEQSSVYLYPSTEWANVKVQVKEVRADFPLPLLLLSYQIVILLY